MAEITASLVKELRERTGAGMMDCKKEHNADVTGFIRFEVGEGIEKVETDFAAEVAAMSKQS